MSGIAKKDGAHGDSQRELDLALAKAFSLMTANVRKVIDEKKSVSLPDIIRKHSAEPQTASVWTKQMIQYWQLKSLLHGIQQLLN